MSRANTTRGTEVWGRRTPWAYTRKVVSFPKRLTSLAIVFALSGSPAVRSACTAYCLHGVQPSAAAHEGMTSEGHAAHTSVAAPAVASVHAHHGSSASYEPAAKATSSPSSHEAPPRDGPRAIPAERSDGRLSATCTNCRADWQFAFAAGPGVERTDTKYLGAAPMPSQVAPFLLTASAVEASPPGPPVPPPSPVRAPLVLRI
jgi:hypothetical protein